MVEKEENVPYSTIITASAASGLIARTLLHPIDTLKARMQVQKTTNLEHMKSLTGINSVYRNTFDAIGKTWQFEGYRGFYRGLGVALFFTGPAQTLFLTSYDVAKKQFAKMFGLPESNFLVHFLSGFSAEAFSCIAWVPHDVMKERLQVMKVPYTEAATREGFRSVLSMVRSDGIRNLYKGYWITLATFGPHSAIYFLCYEKMKQYLATYQRVPADQLSFGSYMAAASVSSAAASVLTNPFDVVKTRYQVQRRALGANSTEVYKGVLDGFRHIYREEGLSAFMKGMPARVAYSAPNAAIIMALYEVFKKVL